MAADQEPDRRRLIWVAPGVVALLGELAAQRRMTIGGLVKALALNEAQNPSIPIAGHKQTIRELVTRIQKTEER